MNASEPTEAQPPRRVAILGVGLLGGSVAKAIRRKIPGVHLAGYSRKAETRELAVSCGALNEAYDTLAETCAAADVVVVATPVDKVADLVIEAAAAAPSSCLITDVGSTKQQIVDRVENDVKAAARFVAAHPIAGSEKTGVQHATETLFDGKMVVLTPSSKTDAGMLARADAFWAATGGTTIQMTPAIHDKHLAAVSHVPHLISSAVTRLATGDALPLVGSGWRDITRVAAGDPGMWTAIVKENRSAIVHQLQALIESATELQTLITSESDSDLESWLAVAQAIRQNAE